MKPHDLSILFSVFEHDRRVKYRSNMLSLCETSNSLLFKNRAASLVLLTVTSVLFLQATAITWTKTPPNPIFGILSKNVTLEWNFTLNSARVLDYVLLQKRRVNDHGFTKVVKYDKNTILFYESFVKKVVMLQNGTTSFMLLNLTKEDEGFYYCEVNTKPSGGGNIAKSYTEYTQLKILVYPTIAVISPNQTVNETSDVTLSCQAKGIPPPTITWLKADVEGKNLSSSSELSLKNINRDQNGLYLCIAKNRAGKAIAYVAVTVHYAPSINLSTKRYDITEGNDLALSCITDGKPLPLVTWTKVGDITNASNPDGQWLTIKKVKTTDAGTYRCTAINGVGKPAVATRQVTVFSPPLIDYVSNNATVNETGSIILFCNTTANPQLNITWDFLSGPNPMNLAKGTTLTLANVNRNQAGTYRCKAENGAKANATANIHVTVNYKPEMKDNSTEEIKSWINHDTEVHCQAEGVPLPEIIWSRKGTVTSVVQAQSRISTLTFKPRKLDDFGSIACYARNFLGSTEKHLVLVSLGMSNAVGLSTFTTTIAATKSSVRPQPTDEVDSKENGEDESKDSGKVAQQESHSSYNAYAVLGGIIGSTGLLVIIVIIAMQRRKHRQANLNKKANKSSQAKEETGYDNDAFKETPVPDEEEDQV